jgi:hypothetical protein
MVPKCFGPISGTPARIEGRQATPMVAAGTSAGIATLHFLDDQRSVT